MDSTPVYMCLGCTGKTGRAGCPTHAPQEAFRIPAEGIEMHPKPCGGCRILAAERDRLEKELVAARECLGRETARLIQERDRYKAALEAILERHGVPCPAEGCGHPRCDFCIAQKALKE